MSLNQEERTAVVTYRLEEEDVLPLVSPAEELIAKVSAMAKKSLDGQC